MYDNVSQKLKSFTKVLTIILLVLIPAGGITGGIFLLLAEAPIGYVIASVLGSAVLALLVYYGSCFAYGLAELLEQQTIATSLLRQVAHSNQSPGAADEAGARCTDLSAAADRSRAAAADAAACCTAAGTVCGGVPLCKAAV